jgi:hypothetical protein
VSQALWTKAGGTRVSQISHADARPNAKDLTPQNHRRNDGFPPASIDWARSDAGSAIAINMLAQGCMRTATRGRGCDDCGLLQQSDIFLSTPLIGSDRGHFWSIWWGKYTNA